MALPSVLSTLTHIAPALKPKFNSALSQENFIAPPGRRWFGSSEASLSLALLRTGLTWFPGPDPGTPKPLIAGIARIYRGLGVSALRSITTHGLLWTLYDFVSHHIDKLPSKQ